ncbi:hypothetical protein [Hwangdonia lutea]|uniref:Uncharacterized protein n=1 Tax=Hwangdonia lutea TaxID=3075823 RepID=A0AA97ENE0_9FLAO|nr:hypothetical protein [Hwangdonia sp. SCSIO 19198]WOD44754.1 hypothetical protein RNZ46_05695 [Hwangdonia sp. SCSIO 19198]
MKYLFLLLLLVDSGCTNSKINQDAIALEYTTQTRGAYNAIAINKKQVATVNKHGAKPNIKICSETAWNQLIKILKTVNVENVPNLKAPSEDRFFDGAAIAHLKITYNGKIYKSQPFDHGNPPKQIAALVKEMLSISKNIE